MRPISADGVPLDVPAISTHRARSHLQHRQVAFEELGERGVRGAPLVDLVQQVVLPNSYKMSFRRSGYIQL